MDELTPTPEQRQELLELAEKATPRPWSYDEPKPVTKTFEGDKFTWIRAGIRMIVGTAGRLLIDDAKYTVAACNLAPGLVREVERLREGIQAAPHGVNCKSRAVIDDTPWDEFTRPVCRSINGCGHCEKCEWKKTRPAFVHFPCNCRKAALAAGKETE